MTSSLAKILIIDDNPQMIENALPMYGYEVETAYDGIEALNKLSKDSSYDLILLDVMMPNLDGYETLKAIRGNKETRFIPVIMLTAQDNDYKQVSGLKFGADDYIVKPFVLPNLLARIEALLRRVDWHKENNTGPKNIPFINARPNAPLTAREKEIMELVAKGLSNREIADKIFVREVTVKTHLNSIYKKLGVENRVQSVLLALQMSLIGG